MKLKPQISFRLEERHMTVAPRLAKLVYKQETKRGFPRNEKSATLGTSNIQKVSAERCVRGPRRNGLPVIKTSEQPTFYLAAHYGVANSKKQRGVLSVIKRQGLTDTTMITRNHLTLSGFAVRVMQNTTTKFSHAVFPTVDAGHCPPCVMKPARWLVNWA